MKKFILVCRFLDFCAFHNKRGTKINSILRVLFCAVLLVVGLSGYEKNDLNRLEGIWVEQHDPAVFAMDVFLKITFD